jgi:hypothetical protein
VPARRIATLVAVAALLGSSLCATASAVPPPPPLVTNGGFENATVDPWVWFSGMVRLAGQADWAPAGGKQSVELLGVLYQDVQTTANQRYDLSFAYAGNPGCVQGPKHLSVSWNGTLAGTNAGSAGYSFDTTGHTAASMGWQTAHVLVDAASVPTHLLFADDGDFSCGIALDNVAMTAPSAGETGVQLTSPDAFTVVGQPVTITATVLDGSAAVTPTGSVQFTVDGVTAGAPAVLTDGKAQITRSDLPRGAHSVSAVYAPDTGSFSPSSVSRSFSVVRAETATGVTLDSSSVDLGQSVAVTASVGVFAPGSGSPSGDIQFSDETGPLGDPVPVGPDGTAQVDVIEDAGDHVIYASYPGDDSFTPSYGQADLTVTDPNAVPPSSGLIGTTTALVSSKNPIAPGESYTVTATVSRATAATATLDGSITFSVNGVTVGSPTPLDGNRSASLTVTPPSGVARQTVRARYGGNNSYSPSVGSLSELIVAPRPPQPPTPPPPPDTQAPFFRVVLTPARLAHALRSGVRAQVDCDDNCSAKLQLRLTGRRARALGIKVRAKSLVVGQGSYDFVDRRSTAIVVRFAARYRKALGKAQLLPLRLTTTASDRAGNDRVRVQTLTLTR